MTAKETLTPHGAVHKFEEGSRRLRNLKGPHINWKDGQGDPETSWTMNLFPKCTAGRTNNLSRPTSKMLVRLLDVAEQRGAPFAELPMFFWVALASEACHLGSGCKNHVGRAAEIFG
jgi:hypothetical protein